MRDGCGLAALKTNSFVVKCGEECHKCHEQQPCGYCLGVYRFEKDQVVDKKYETGQDEQYEKQENTSVLPCPQLY